MLTRQEARWGYLASIVHLIFAVATTVGIFVVMLLGIDTGKGFSPTVAYLMAVSMPASLSMVLVVAILALKWSTSTLFRTTSAIYVIVAVITFYSTITPIAAWLHPDAFGGPDSGNRMLFLGIHELEYYFLVALYLVSLAVTDRDRVLPAYARILTYALGLNTLCMIAATLLCGHGTVYQINMLLAFVMYPLFVTGLVIMMRRLRQATLQSAPDA